MSSRDIVDVTVVIVTWNAARVIARCLQALRLQTVRPSRVIVMDNGSTDATSEILAGFPEVSWVPLARNEGFARANNLAISRCRTQWIALLNPDAFAETDWLENLHNAAQRYPEAAAFGSLQLSADPAHAVDGAGDVVHFSGLIWRNWYGCEAKPGLLMHAPYPVFSACAAAALYRRDVFLKVGGFDEDFFCYGEDVDLGFRLRLAGYEILQVSQARVVHIGSGLTGGRRSAFSVFYGQRNLFWIYLKNMPGWIFWVFLPLHLVMHFAQIARYCIQGHCLTVWRAKIEALRGTRKMWLQRRRIQEMRVVCPSKIWRLLNKSLFPHRCGRF